MTNVPDLVPARMVNEFEYCQRLFYLEWVQSQFSENAYTVEGQYVHRNTDLDAGIAGGPEEEVPVRRATSVLVSSPRLGLIAKADIIEGKGSKVVPVEVKRGRPPKHGPAWSPELIQLCAIGLILQDNGYDCSEGQIYFATSRQRVKVEFDENLTRRTLALLQRLRVVAASPDPPPPLVDSPKCPKCSLVGICLPDEMNVLTHRSEIMPRRLVPRDVSARPLYVTVQGARIGIRQNRIRVSQADDVIQELRMIDASQISIYGNVQISSQAMRAAFRHQIPVCWFSYGGWFQGIAHGLPSKNVDLRRRQVAIAAQAGLPIARKMIEGKIRNCRTLLRRNSRVDVKSTLTQLKRVAEKVSEVGSIESLLGLEGAAARLYFSGFSAMLKDHSLGVFDFDGRNRRPPRDVINCLLSFVYALLTKDLTAVTIAIGFDPYLGVFHKPRFGRPALALDLAEEFRPIVADSVVVGVINNGEVKKSAFVIRAQGVALTQAGRKSLIAAYERRLECEVRHPVYGYSVSYRRVLEVQARMLGAYLLGEVPEYVPFMTR